MFPEIIKALVDILDIYSDYCRISKRKALAAYHEAYHTLKKFWDKNEIIYRNSG
jgi:hypothetical protein